MTDKTCRARIVVEAESADAGALYALAKLIDITANAEIGVSITRVSYDRTDDES